MLINLLMWINSQAVRVKSDDAGLLVNVPNLLAYNKNNKRIIALGKTEDEMRKQSPLGWKAWASLIRFTAPFDVKAFDPLIVHNVLRYYAYRASARLRPGAFGQWFGLLVDRFTYDVQFAGYESVPQDARDRFEDLLRKDRFFRRVRINNQNIK